VSKSGLDDGIAFPERWLAYFDILGFSALIEKHHPYFILEMYEDALKASHIPQSAEINRIHFSDTFVFYSADDTPQSYAWMQSVAKNFVYTCVYKSIPLRGAIAFGEFYANEEKNIYFGKAFIEAYQEAESQDWIGLVLTKTAEARVHQYNNEEEYKDKINPLHHNFLLSQVPRNSKCLAGSVITKEQQSSKYFVYDFHKGSNIDGVLTRLQEMQASAPQKAKKKYQNTISYIGSK